MSEEATRQSDNIVPPRTKVWVQLVDSTSRVYDLTAQNLGTTYDASHTTYVFLTIQADGADIYYCFDNVNSRTLDETAATAAGGAPSFPTTACLKCPDGQERSYRIQRNLDLYLYLKTSTGTGRARIYASSQPSASAKGA